MVTFKKKKIFVFIHVIIGKMTDLVLSTLNLHTKKDNDYKKVFTLSLPNNFLNKK